MEDFTGLENRMSNDNGGKKHKARSSYATLRHSWRYAQVQPQDYVQDLEQQCEICAHVSLWLRVVESCEGRYEQMDTFHNSCLRKICNI